MLEALAKHPGKLLTHRWLLERVWDPGYSEDVDVLRVFISQLRRKIEEDPGLPRIISTDPGIGYRWSLRPAEDPETRSLRSQSRARPEARSRAETLSTKEPKTEPPGSEDPSGSTPFLYLWARAAQGRRPAVLLSRHVVRPDFCGCSGRP